MPVTGDDSVAMQARVSRLEKMLSDLTNITIPSLDCRVREVERANHDWKSTLRELEEKLAAQDIPSCVSRNGADECVLARDNSSNPSVAGASTAVNDGKLAEPEHKQHKGSTDVGRPSSDVMVKSPDLSESVQLIGNHGEFDMKSLKERLSKKVLSNIAGNEFIASIKIPASVESIGEKCFRQCKSLSEVTFCDGSQLKRIGMCAFDGHLRRKIRIP